MGGGGSVTNQIGGKISALYGIRAGAPITIVNADQIFSNAATLGAGLYASGGGLVTNLVGARVTASGQGGDGIRAKSQPLTVVNAGQITGQSNKSIGSGISLLAGGIITNQSKGQITGLYGVKASGGATTIVNYGVLKASNPSLYDISLGAGFANRLVLHPGGNLGGTISGGNTFGAPTISTLELAANSVAATGNLTGLGATYINFGLITVDSGARWQFNGANTEAYGVTLSDSGSLTIAGTLTDAAGAAGTNAGTAGAAGTGGQRGASPGTVTSGGSLNNPGIINGGAGGAGGAGVAGSAADGDLGGKGGAGGIGTSALSLAGTSAQATNSGAITGGAGGAGGTGGDAGANAANDGGAGGAERLAAPLYLSSGLLTNDATIFGGAGGNAGAGGANFSGTGAAGGAGGAGVNGSSGNVINNGTIGGGAGGTGGSGGVTGASGAGAAGVSFTFGGTVTNNGVIAGASGADAIDFGTGTSRLIYVPGATFTGTVNGGNTIGGAFVSTVELGTSTSAGALAAEGTLTNLGTEFQNFAQVRVDAGAFWNMGGGDSLASGATLTDLGILLVSGQTIAGGGAVTIASTASVIASETVTANGVWSGMSALVVGGAGNGAFLVSNLGTAGAASIDVAASAGGAGTVTVVGTKSVLTDSGSFTVGDAGLGGLSVSAGGTATAASMVVGNGAGANGSSVDVSGAFSQLNVTGALTVGVTGSGSMSLSGGGTVTAGSLDAGISSTAVANISVVGPATDFAVTGAATVGDDGTGVLSVLNGATFSADSLTIGSQGNSSGALVVSGAGSVINLTGSLNIGTALGVGDLTIGPGGAVHAAVVNLQGQVVLEGGNLDPTVTIINQGQTAGGNGTLQAGDIIDEGVIQAGGTKPSQRLLVVQGTVMGGGTLTINGTVQPSNPVGALQINASGTMELTGPVLNAATTTFTDNLAQPGTFTVNNSIVDVTFADALGVGCCSTISRGLAARLPHSRVAIHSSSLAVHCPTSASATPTR